MEVSGLLHAPAPFTPEVRAPVPIKEEAGWAPEPVWTLGSREKYIAPTGNRTRDVAIPTELSGLNVTDVIQIINNKDVLIIFGRSLSIGGNLLKAFAD
jgi:hypothetical protein